MKDYDVIICVLKNDSYDSRELEERLYEVQKKMAEEADGKCRIRKSIVCGDGKVFVLEDVKRTDILYVNGAGRDYSFRQALLLSMAAFRKEADGRYGLWDVINGKIALDVECNPMHGPKVEQIIMRMEEGKKPAKYTYVKEGLFSMDDSIESVKVGENEYKVKKVTEDLINSRPY